MLSLPVPFVAILLTCLRVSGQEIHNSDVRHDGDPAGFSVVSYTSFGPVTADTIIPLGIVEANLGGWDGVSNAFLAPSDGVYFFSASVGSQDGTPCAASIAHNNRISGRPVATVSTSSVGPAGDANSIILQLSAGDIVALVMHGDGVSQSFSSPDEVLTTFVGIQISNPNATLRHDGEPVGFSVRAAGPFGPIAMDTNIPFPIVEAEEGGGWNGVTNSFQAPGMGAYLFTASIGSTNTTGCTASIVHSTTTGSRRVATMTTSNEGPIGDSQTILLMLGQGDYVSVQLHADGGSTHTSSDEMMVTFTGVLM